MAAHGSWESVIARVVSLPLSNMGFLQFSGMRTCNEKPYKFGNAWPNFVDRVSPCVEMAARYTVLLSAYNYPQRADRQYVFHPSPSPIRSEASGKLQLYWRESLHAFYPHRHFLNHMVCLSLLPEIKVAACCQPRLTGRHAWDNHHVLSNGCFQNSKRSCSCRSPHRHSRCSRPCPPRSPCSNTGVHHPSRLPLP
jgi:hypothetical protein